MPLTFEAQLRDDVVVIRCKGRIAFGSEIDALQAEVEKNTKVEGTGIFCIKKVVLQLAETNYIDSSGLGTLVRMLGILSAAGGGLKLCELSPTILKTLEVTNLGVLFPAYSSEAEAMQAFDAGLYSASQDTGSSGKRIVCVDTSADLLAGLRALLSHSGYEVFTTRFIGEAATLVKATRPKVVICGASVMAVPTGPAVIEKLNQMGSAIHILHLRPDFHIAEAGDAGQEVLSQVRSLMAT